MNGNGSTCACGRSPFPLRLSPPAARPQRGDTGGTLPAVEEAGAAPRDAWTALRRGARCDGTRVSLRGHACAPGRDPPALLSGGWALASGTPRAVSRPHSPVLAGVLLPGDESRVTVDARVA